MKRGAANSGVSLMELMISVALTSILMGALLISSLSIQKAIHGSETFASNYAAQRRLVDYLARDLRRSLGAWSADAAGGSRVLLASTPVSLSATSSLVLTVPGYYQSDTPGDPSYDDALSVVQTEGAVDYGTTEFAPPVEVVFRKLFVASERCVCYIRQEAGATEIVVRDAAPLDVEISRATDGRTGVIKAAFTGPLSSRAIVTTRDEVMLRNAPPGFAP